MNKKTMAKLAVFAALLVLTLCVCVGAMANEEIIVHQHTWTQQSVTAANCSHGNIYYYVCSVCGEKKSEDDGNVLSSAHSWPSTPSETKEATCTADGYQTFICLNSQHHIKTVTLPATGHNWGNWEVVTAPTCTTDGQNKRTCSKCGAIETMTVPALGHNYGAWIVDTKPTCTTAGQQHRVCSRDASHIEYQAIPATGHNWGDWIVDKQPTCTATGSQHRICANDPSHRDDATIPALGHNWGPWKVTKQPTLFEEGERERVCTRCGEKQVEKLDKIKDMYNNTLCVFGPRIKDTDLTPYNDTVWYMFTPFDASVDGRQVYELVVSDMFIVGTATIDVSDGNITFNYNITAKRMKVNLEFFTIVNQISDLKGVYNPESLKAYSMDVNRPYSIEDTFGGDTNLVLYFCSRVDYTYDNVSYAMLQYESAAHRRLVREMLNMMDK